MKPGRWPLDAPTSLGVTAGTAQDTLVLAYNDPADLSRGAAGNVVRKIAGVIFEPVVGNMGCVIPTREFLTALRSVSERHGALLIADEVMTGFRVAYGGGSIACLASSLDIDHAGQDCRWRIASRRLWRPGRRHGPYSASRQSLPSRHA